MRDRPPGPLRAGRPVERPRDAARRGARFRHRDGAWLHHHLGVSAFARYTVAARESLIAIAPEVPLDKAALFGCAVVIGVGAVVNTAGVEPGARVAVFGLGGVGLAVVLGARLAGALQVVAIDLLAPKLELARRLGATHTVGAGEGWVIDTIREITRGGVDYAFEAVGNARVLSQAYLATRRGGTTITVGLPHPDHRLELQAVSLVTEARSLLGSYMGAAIPSRDIPPFLELYMAGRLPVDELISQRVDLHGVNAAFDRLREGTVVQQLLHF